MKSGATMAGKARTFNISELVGIAVVTSLLVVNAVLNYRNTQQLRRDAEKVTHSHRVLDLTADILLALVNAETGERGYLLTTREEYLEPFDQALPRLNADLGELESATAGDSWQVEKVATLKALAAESHCVAPGAH